MIARLTWALLLLAAFDASAARFPSPGELDHRIRTAYYSPDQVFEITGFFGFQTLVQFAENERIVRIAGYDEGWKIDDLGNKFLISPKEDESDSNLTVITDRRTYFFDLTVKPYPQGSKVRSQAKDAQQTYSLRFLYPSDEGKQLERDIRDAIKEDIQAAADELESSQAQPESEKHRKLYSYMGNDAIRPHEVYDDEKFTYFKFSDQQSLPSIFVVNEDGSESIVNKHIDGGMVVVQRTAQQFVLRLGKSVVCIYNENPQTTKVKSPEPSRSERFERVIKGHTK